MKSVKFSHSVADKAYHNFVREGKWDACLQKPPGSSSFVAAGVGVAMLANALSSDAGFTRILHLYGSQDRFQGRGTIVEGNLRQGRSRYTWHPEGYSLYTIDFAQRAVACFAAFVGAMNDRRTRQSRFDSGDVIKMGRLLSQNRR